MYQGFTKKIGNFCGSRLQPQIWTDIAIATFGCSSDEFSDFFYLLINFASCVPFLLIYDNQPVSTAMVYCGNKVAGIYACELGIRI